MRFGEKGRWRMNKKPIIEMDCPKCGGCAIISEWDGWRWMCIHCGWIGREASKAAIEHQEERQRLADREWGCRK